MGYPTLVLYLIFLGKPSIAVDESLGTLLNRRSRDAAQNDLCRDVFDVGGNFTQRDFLHVDLFARVIDIDAH